jgi:hypothetical protein
MANGLKFAMPIALRTDFGALAMRSAARRSKDGAQARRLLALAAIYDGASRTEAARIGGVTLQIVRDRVIKFNAGGPDGLIDRKASGQPSLLNPLGYRKLSARPRHMPRIQTRSKPSKRGFAADLDRVRASPRTARR